MFPIRWVEWSTTGDLMQHCSIQRDGSKRGSSRILLPSRSLHSRYDWLVRNFPGLKTSFEQIVDGFCLCDCRLDQGYVLGRTLHISR